MDVQVTIKAIYAMADSNAGNDDDTIALCIEWNGVEVELVDLAELLANVKNHCGMDDRQRSMARSRIRRALTENG